MSTSPRLLARILASITMVAAMLTSGAGLARADEYRWDMYRHTNHSRLGHEVHRVSLQRRMSEIAERHSRKMARANTLFHTSNVGVYLDGVRWHVWGENVGWTTGSTWHMERSFMKSSPHRGNILNRAFDHVAIGTASAHGKLFVTVFFYG